MDIVMLGHSGAGKTTYVAALYYRMANGLYDYTMEYGYWDNYMYKRYVKGNFNYTLGEAEREGVELKSVSQNIRKGLYPPPTAIKQEYVFRMTYKDMNSTRWRN